MIFVVGGYAQGKQDYVKKRFAEGKHHLLNLNEWTRHQLREKTQEEPQKRAEQENDDQKPEWELLEQFRTLLREEPELIVISTEIGSGVIPMDKEARAFRRILGRLQCQVADLAEEVVKVTCGIGVRIK